ncbi:MAG: hypothetical protein WCQ26_02360 [Pseudanabaena sp. ELA748]
MSQEGFGDSSSQKSISPLMPEPQTLLQSVSPNVISETTTLFNALPRQVLEQELQFCNERSQQAQVLLKQAQEQLQLSQLVIQRQETLTQTLQSRIDQLEHDLQDMHNNSDQLRDRLKRQQHHTSQLKAALERCLETSAPANNNSANHMALSALESWSIAKLADEKIAPVESINDLHLQKVVKIVPTPQPIDLEDAQEVTTFSADSSDSHTSQQEHFQSQDPVKAQSQPISPLIVRPHRASQGSPISLDLPVLQNLLEPKHEPKQEPINVAKAIANHESNKSLDLPASSNSAATSSSMLSSVAIPKFMQALYSNPNSVKPEYEEPEQLSIANPSSRKAVTSLAAVQLPQFPPLPRRR